MSAVLLRSVSNWSHHDGTPNPLLVFFHNGMKKDDGWLRLEENEYDKYTRNKNGQKKGEMKKQLSAAENTKLIAIKSEID